MNYLRILYLCIITLLVFSCSAKTSNEAGDGNIQSDSIKDEPEHTPSDEATLLFVGDAMQHKGQLNQALLEGGGSRYDYSDCFALFAPIVSEADYAIVNLEVTLGGGPNYSGYPNFSAPDAYAQALKDAGFDLFLTANNHCLDTFDKGARRTLSVLDEMGVDHIGTYDNSAQRDTLVPFIKDIDGIKIGFLNYTYGTNGIMPRKGVEVAYIDKKKIKREIEKTKEAGAEIICVAIHWGEEYHPHENKHQRSLAQFIIDQGADLIIGGHPHVIQPMEVVRNEAENKDVIVVYSLGNFISNMKTTDTCGGAMVKVKVGREADGRAVFKSAMYDILFAAKPTGKGSNYKVYPSSSADSIPADQKQQWRMFERNARKVFDECNVNVPPISE